MMVARHKILNDWKISKNPRLEQIEQTFWPNWNNHHNHHKEASRVTRGSALLLLFQHEMLQRMNASKPHTFLLSSTRWSSNALTVGKSKTNEGLRAIWNSLATILIKETLDKLSMPASIKGLSNSSSSSVAMTSFTKVMSCFLTKAGSRPLGLAATLAGAAAWATCPSPPPPPCAGIIC